MKDKNCKCHSLKRIFKKRHFDVLVKCANCETELYSISYEEYEIIRNHQLRTSKELF